jgi:hypothetical protein
MPGMAAMTAVNGGFTKIAAARHPGGGNELLRVSGPALRALAVIWVRRRGDLLELMIAGRAFEIEECHASIVACCTEVQKFGRKPTEPLDIPWRSLKS